MNDWKTIEVQLCNPRRTHEVKALVVGDFGIHQAPYFDECDCFAITHIPSGRKLFSFWFENIGGAYKTALQLKNAGKIYMTPEGEPTASDRTRERIRIIGIDAYYAYEIIIADREYECSE